MRRGDEPVVVAAAKCQPVAASQGVQDHRLAARAGGRIGSMAADAGHRVWVRGGVGDRLAGRAAAPDRRLVPAGDRRVGRAAGRRPPRPGVAGPGPRRRLGARLAPPHQPRAGPGVPAAGPPRHPRRAHPRGRAVEVAELRHHHRARRLARLRPDHLRRPAMAPPGPHRQGPRRRPRRRPAAGPRREDPGRRDHPRNRAPLAPGAHPAAPGARPSHGDRRIDRQRGRPT
jgi:hypothetical protein